MRVGQNFNPQFIRSKGCRDCGKRIFYNMSKHEWTDDDGSEGFRRHACEKWTSRSKEDLIQATFEKVQLLEHKTEKNASLLQEIKIKLDAVLSERNNV